jgi:large subunit ribosomal protein L18
MATTKLVARTRRHARVRKRLAGTAQRPRLAVFRSNKHIYAQVIDDVTGRTLAAASTVEGEKAAGSKSDVAKGVGQRLGERAKQAGVEAVVFDRGGYKFHGRVRQIAEGAREAGLKF